MPLPPFDYTPMPYDGPSPEEVLALRKEHVSPGIFHYYKKPIMVVEGKGQYLFDEKGRRYLDGFADRHRQRRPLPPRCRRRCQSPERDDPAHHHDLPAPEHRALREGTRREMPGDLKVCYFVNSGSEAERPRPPDGPAYTGNYDVIALRNAYHGGSPSARP